MADSGLASGGKRAAVLLVASVILLTGVARLVTTERQGAWHDEWYTLAMLKGFDAYLFSGSDLLPTESIRTAGWYQERLQQDEFWNNLNRNLIHEGHPPLYYILGKAWTFLRGWGPRELREFSVLLSLLMIAALAYGAGISGGAWSAVVIASLAAVSPSISFFSQECRSYSLGFLALSIAVAGVFRREREEAAGGLSLALFLLGTLLAVYTHYYLIVAVGLLVPCWILASGRSAYRNQSFIALLPMLAFVPWLPILRQQVNAHSGSHWTEGSVGIVPGMISYSRDALGFFFAPNGGASGLETLAFAVMLMLGSVGMLRAGSRRLVIIWVILITAPIANGFAVYLIDLLTDHHTIQVPRYSFAILVPMLLLVSIGLPRLGRFGALILAVFLVFSAARSWEVLSGERDIRQMIRETASFVAQNSEGRDIVIVVPSGPTLLGLAYYLPAHIQVAAAPSLEKAWVLADEHSSQWIALQNLGDESGTRVIAEADKLSGMRDVRRIRFAGIDLLRLSIPDATD